MSFTSLPRLVITSALVLGLSGIYVSNGMAAAPQNRIVTAANTGEFATIPHSVQPKARLASDLGPKRGDARLQGLSIHFNMSTAQQAALDQLLVDQQKSGRVQISPVANSGAVRRAVRPLHLRPQQGDYLAPEPGFHRYQRGKRKNVHHV